MEGVNHIDIVQIGRSGLVSHVYGVIQGHAPYREGFKLGVSGLDAALVLLIELAKAHCHFAAAGAGSCDNYKGLGGFNIVVLAKALV